MVLGSRHHVIIKDGGAEVHRDRAHAENSRRLHGKGRSKQKLAVIRER